MGYWKDQLAKDEKKEHAAKRMAINAGAIRVCEFHGSTYEGVEEATSAYKLGQSRFSAGKLSDVFESRTDMTDTIKYVIEDQPAKCPQCVAFDAE